ncbi:MAG: YicC/YloC family endoribonuclease [Bacteroidales bacterium]
MFAFILLSTSIKNNPMLQSMTGYGKAEIVLNEKKIMVELRSVNSKQLDLTLRLPSLYRELETEVRKLLGVLQRGKVECFISVEKSVQTKMSINEPSFKAYYTQLKMLLGELGDSVVPVGEILRLPEVISAISQEVSNSEREQIVPLVQQAIDALLTFRQQEGQAMKSDILHRVEIIGSLLLETEQFDGQRIIKIRERIEQMLSEAVGAEQVDRNRLEQELIYYIERLDVTEEKTRLRAHCDYFIQVAQEEATGRKLGFIAQEMGREINTLGSKANDGRMQRMVVCMKDELEKIKEQLLNIL